MLSPDTFISTQSALLALDKTEESAQNKLLFDGQSPKDLEQQGVCVTKLIPHSVATGLYGRRVVVFGRDEMPNHSFSSGDIACVTHRDLSAICEGIVSKLGKATISVAFDVLSEDVLGLNNVCLIKLSKSVTFTRLEKCLKHIEKGDNPLIEKLLTSQPSLSSPTPSSSTMTPFNCNLNTGQRAAVQLTLQRSDLAIIHGPPGRNRIMKYCFLIG